MKFKSAVITAGSGSVGGLTVAHNAAGMYFRGRSIPTDPGSTQQTAIRNAFAFLSNYWISTLTESQRVEWQTYADNVTVLDQFGDAIHISGFNHFMRSNTLKKSRGIAPVADGPANFNVGEFSSPTPTASEAAQEVAIAFTDTDEWANEDDSRMHVFISRPQNVSINFFKGPYRYAGAITGNSVAPPVTPADIAVPFAIVEDQKVFVRFQVNRADGRLSNSYRTFCTCAA